MYPQKKGDVNQDFCQSFPPDVEHYICCHSVGCPITLSDKYYKLKKTLYSLEWLPSHFLLSMSKTTSDLPLYFIGCLDQRPPSSLLRLYVKDFLYFGKSEEIENTIEQKFGSEIDTNFNGRVRAPPK